jgi:hypothetical protein
VSLELAKLHRAGHFPDIAEAGLLVGLIHLFEVEPRAHESLKKMGEEQPQRSNELNEYDE